MYILPSFLPVYLAMFCRFEKPKLLRLLYLSIKCSADLGIFIKSEKKELHHEQYVVFFVLICFLIDRSSRRQINRPPLEIPPNFFFEGV